MINRLFRAFQAFGRLRIVPQDLASLRKQAVSLANRADILTRILAEPELARILSSPELSATNRLERFGFKGLSQNDEDGILEEIFRRIGTTNRHFVEFGTGDGLENNTAYLLWQGWSGLWIDGSVELHQAQLKNYEWARREGRLACVRSLLTRDNINSVIGTAGLRGEIDLVSIDVDGIDYHLWKALEVVQPRVVVIEYNGFLRPPICWIMDYDENYVWDGSRYVGASLEALVVCGANKGYTLVGCNVIGLNCFFVRNDLVADKFYPEPTAKALFHPRRWWLDIYYRTGAVPFDRAFVRE